MRLLSFFLFFLFLQVKSQYYVGLALNYTRYHVTMQVEPKSVSSDGSLYVHQYPSNIVKKTANGNPDLSFGNNGSITNAFQYDISNNMIVAGQSLYLTSYGKIAKYNLVGVLDTSFGNNGVLNLTTDPGYVSTSVNAFYLSNNWMYFIKNQATDAFVHKIEILRSNFDGQVDNTFHMLLPSGEGLVGITESNIIYRRNGNNITKYDDSGVKDMNFGNSGSMAIPASYKLFLDDKNNDIYFTKLSPLQITKYTSNGTLDSSFGVNGTKEYSITTPFNQDVYINGVKRDSNNNLLFYGGGASFSTIFRVNDAGLEDYNFNNGLYYSVIRNTLSGGPVIINYVGIIKDMKLLNDSTYLCFEEFGFGSNGTQFAVDKFIRTNDISTLNVADVKDNKTNLKIYPNPVKDILSVDLNSNEKLELIEIFDMTGKLVKKSTFLKNNISDINKGMYLIKIKTNKSTYSSKIIKN